MSLADIQKNVRINLQVVVEDLKESSAEVESSVEGAADELKNFGETSEEVNDAVKDVGSTMEEQSRKSFPSWALSVMFLGQQMVSSIRSIASSASGAFNEVQNSIEDNETGFNRLSNAMFGLRYSVGRALEPLADRLAEAVDSFSEFTDKHPELVEMAAAISAIVGGLALVVGTGRMALFAFTQLGKVFSTVLIPIIKAFGVITAAAFFKIAAIVLVVIAAWVSNFAGFRDRVTEMFESLLKNIKRIWNGLKSFFSGLLDIIVGIFEGDTDRILEGMRGVASGIIRIFGSVAHFVSTLLVKTSQFFIDVFIKAVSYLGDRLFAFFEWAASGMDDLFGTNIASNFQELRKLNEEGAKIASDAIGDGLDYLLDGLDEGIDSFAEFVEGGAEGEAPSIDGMVDADTRVPMTRVPDQAQTPANNMTQRPVVVNANVRTLEDVDSLISRVDRGNYGV